MFAEELLAVTAAQLIVMVAKGARQQAAKAAQRAAGHCDVGARAAWQTAAPGDHKAAGDVRVQSKRNLLRFEPRLILKAAEQADDHVEQIVFDLVSSAKGAVFGKGSISKTARLALSGARGLWSS